MFLTPAFLFILFGLAEYLGFSGPIVALTFGVTMGNIPFLTIFLQKRRGQEKGVLQPVSLSDSEHSFLSEVVFLLQTLFFVYVGISLAIGGLVASALGVGLAVAMFVVRLPVVRVMADKDLPVFDRSLMAIMIPKGLAAAVLATLVGQAQVPGAELIAEVTYMIILTTVILTSALMFLLYKTGLRGVYGRLVGSGKPAVATDTSPNLVG